MHVPSVKATNNTLFTCKTHEGRDQATRKVRLRDETNPSGLKWAKCNISKELGDGGRAEVNEVAVVLRIFEADVFYSGLLPEFVTTELEGALDCIPNGCWAKASEEGACALIGDDLPEGSNHALHDAISIPNR